jgi:predicted lipoprotein
VILVVAVAVLLVAMALDTRVVRIGSTDDIRTAAFSPEAFGAENFPPIRARVLERAVDAKTLAEAIAADKKAAGETYGTPSSVGPVIAVRFTGTAGEAKAGVYTLTVAELPPEITLRVRTGPAINGTELRDYPGTIVFGNFKNQIEYQNAGSGINNAMKAEVLAGIDTKALGGRTLDVVGVFRLVNEKNWLVTPVSLVVR